MSKKLMMNSSAGENVIVLCKDYSPNGEKFYLWKDKPINLNEYELYMNVDFANCNANVYENILSVGLNITQWGNGNLHIYRKNNALLVACVDSGQMQLDFKLNLMLNEIVINKDGVFINNIAQNFDKNNSIYISVMNRLFSSSISVGSQEGINRSNATYHLVCLRKYVKRGE